MFYRSFLKFLLISFLIINSIPLISCNSNKAEKTNPITYDEQELIDWFNSFNPQWSKAIKDNKPDYIIKRYHKDAIIGAPGRDFVQGKEMIANYWINLAVYLDDFSYETQKIGGNPKDILYENGIAFATYTVNGKKVTDTTKYLFVWKHVGNRNYKVLSEMFNSIK